MGQKNVYASVKSYSKRGNLLKKADLFFKRAVMKSVEQLRDK